jgi:hypothetical protein
MWPLSLGIPYGKDCFPKKRHTIMELIALIIEACKQITEDMCRRVINKSQSVLKKLPDVMVVILNTWFMQDKCPCKGLSFCMLVSSIVIEIKILLINQILDHFVCHPIQNTVGWDTSFMHKCFWKTEQSRYTAGLPSYMFRRTVWTDTLKRNVCFYYIYQWMLVIMNNNRKLFIITNKSDCHEIYHIYHCFW